MCIRDRYDTRYQGSINISSKTTHVRARYMHACASQIRNSKQKAPLRLPGYNLKLTNKNTFQHLRSMKYWKCESDLGIEEQIGVWGSLEISVSCWLTHSVAVGANTTSASCVQGKTIAFVAIADHTGISHQHIVKKRTVKPSHINIFALATGILIKARPFHIAYY